MKCRFCERDLPESEFCEMEIYRYMKSNPRCKKCMAYISRMRGIAEKADIKLYIMPVTIKNGDLIGAIANLGRSKCIPYDKITIPGKKLRKWAERKLRA